VPTIATVIFSFVVYGALALKEQLNQAEFEPHGDFQQQIVEQMARAAITQGTKLLEVKNQMIEFNKAMGMAALLIVAWFGSGLFCEDRRAGAHQLYFARPITRLDYFLGKFSIGACFALSAVLAPMLVICTVASVSSENWTFLREEWDTIPRAIGFSCLWTAVVVSIVLLSSSLAPRRSFALIGVFGFFMLSEAVGNALGEIVDSSFRCLSLTRDLSALASAIFATEDPWTEVTAFEAWSYVLGLMVFAWFVISLRLRRLEVVA
jgi:ABC-type transport system involved in multi-copper enzyme maturation permease subunit